VIEKRTAIPEYGIIVKRNKSASNASIALGDHFDDLI
jgi:hypothetical protein